MLLNVFFFFFLTDEVEVVCFSANSPRAGRAARAHTTAHSPRVHRACTARTLRVHRARTARAPRGHRAEHRAAAHHTVEAQQGAGAPWEVLAFLGWVAACGFAFVLTLHFTTQ